VCKQRQLKRSCASGQATVEYVLLIGITVILVLGIVYQFNSAFRGFADQLFVGEDSYLACLIKTGTLPFEAGDTCEQPHFDLKSGKTKLGGVASGGSGAGGSGAGAGGRDGDAAKNKTASAGAGRVREGGGGGVPLSRADSGFGGQYGNLAGDTGGAGGKKSGSGDGDYTGSDKVSSTVGGLGESGKSGDRDGLRPGYVPLSGAQGKASRKSGVDKIPTNERDLKTAREIAIEKERKRASLEADEKGFTFGWFFKIVLIVALIFAILFFVGSQFVAVVRGSQRE
jgi:hypothetical protein